MNKIDSLPLISIVTVVYNAAATLEFTLRSVIGQTYNNIEYIIIDGASTDGTVELLKKYEKSIQKLVSEKDAGIYDAMNKALGMANGDFLLFLGADDLLISPTIIEELVPYLINPTVVYYGNSYIPTINKLYRGKTNKWSLALGNVSHQAVFYPKIIYSIKKYDVSYRIFADHIYNIQVFASPDNRFQYIPRLISLYSGTGVSSYAKDKKYEKMLLTVIIQELGFTVGVYVWLRRLMSSILNKM